MKRTVAVLLLALLGLAALNACQTTAQPNPHGRMPVYGGGP